MTSKSATRAAVVALMACSIGPGQALAGDDDLSWRSPAGRPATVVAPMTPMRILIQTQSDDPQELTPPMSRRLREALSDEPAEPSEEDRRRRDRLRELLRDIPRQDDETTLEDFMQRDGQRRPSGDAADESADVDQDDQASRLLSKPFIDERLPEPTGAGFNLPPLRAVSSDTSAIGNGRLPEDFDSGSTFAPLPLPQSPAMRPGWVTTGLIRPWAAPNTFNHPLYFEDRMLERHGHDRFGYLQPFAGGVRFMSQAIMLPYLATVQPPCDIVYSKGYFRAGSPAPLLYQRPPYERRAAAVQAASTAGAFIALP